MTRYIIIFLSSVIIASFSQILLKKSAAKRYSSILEEYLNPKVIVAYGLFFASTLLTIFAYKKVPLSMGPVLEATGYIWVAVLGWAILRERISRKKLIGLGVIIIGVLIFAA